MKKSRSVTFICLLLLALQSFAQTNGESAGDNAPFRVGETLTYEGKLSKIISGMAIADLKITITRPDSSDDYLIKSEARSKGSLLKLFRYSFLQQYDSTIGRKEFRVLKTVKHDVQKDRVRDGEALFDYRERRVTYTEVDPKEPMRPPRKIASDLTGTAHDLLSGIYALRLLPLEAGKTFELTVSDSGLVYRIPIKVTARVQQKSIFGKVWCFRVEPQIFGPRRLIEQEGSMIIWMTDDNRRLPVRSQINSPFGKIEVKLKTAQNLQ